MECQKIGKSRSSQRLFWKNGMENQELFHLLCQDPPPLPQLQHALIFLYPWNDHIISTRNKFNKLKVGTWHSHLSFISYIISDKLYSSFGILNNCCLINSPWHDAVTITPVVHSESVTAHRLEYFIGSYSMRGSSILEDSYY